MRLIDADELIERAKELYKEMEWGEREVHFSLLDLEANVFSMQKPREVKEMEMKIADLEAHILYLEKKNSALKGEIKALEFAVRCNGVSGNEVRYETD